jgi:hypothetical protein
MQSVTGPKANNGFGSDHHGSPAARLIAFFLPQFHPIPENDRWWGKGFTEWTNVTKAKPLFRGHHQPNLPGELGFYDLRVAETRQAQADLARAHGIEGFCYWHYWFAGKRLLERPFNEVLQSGKPDFPFCLAWANQTWSGIWHGAPNRILQLQTYPGLEDHKAHFSTLLRACTDDRYITIDRRPLFLIYDFRSLPGIRNVTDLWRELADKEALPGLHLVGIEQDAFRVGAPSDFGLDGIAISNHTKKLLRDFPGPLTRLKNRLRKAVMGWPKFVCPYKDAIPTFLAPEVFDARYYPTVVPNWDNTPRSGRNGWVLHGSTPELFRDHVRQVVGMVQHKPAQHRLVFVKSWNEWAEGNYLEPDRQYGRAYLEVVRDEVLAGEGLIRHGRSGGLGQLAKKMPQA